MFDKNRFKAQMVLMQVTNKMLADELGIDVATLYRKINADGNFTRAEINHMIIYLKIADPMSVFFASELAQNASPVTTT